MKSSGRMRASPPQTHDPTSVQLADILCGTMHRWKSLTMRACPHTIQLFLDNCVGYTPNLSEITVIPREIDNDNTLPTLSIPFRHPIDAGSGSLISGPFIDIPHILVAGCKHHPAYCSN
ncbi:hypothetical protein BOTBODRAFT_30431 [Botryobasidium botryosum FD-172 SS1]|uniref:Uncharacterized protein n=1 Tax=Botryobasidium botryosum (strain FD-172 SS1) TaxID=930990 RepID=A0A067MMP0_BOTB1|nr:hypothetical protein BOTBODRAFT_30431 [Botryobasidium botryosum FD-172 SS1]